MDIEMPVMDGYEATKQLRLLEDKLEMSKTSRAYIIGLTGHTSELYKMKCIDYGMDDYMTKPVEGPRLKEVLTYTGLI